MQNAASPRFLSSTLIGALWMVGAILSFSTMAVAGRGAALRHDTFELMAYRSVIGLVIMLIIFQTFNRWGALRNARWGLHLSRNIFHFIGQNLWFYAITVLPLAQVFAVEFSTPLWVLLLSPIFLGEHLTRVRMLAAGLGFCGILIVARPFDAGFDPNLGFAASAAIGFAATITITKILTRTERVETILLLLTGMQTVMGFFCAGFDGAIRLPDSQSMPWLALIALCGLSAHFSLTKALSHAPANVVLPIDYVRLPLIACVGWLFYDEPLVLWVFLGAAVIFLGNYINLRAEFKDRN